MVWLLMCSSAQAQPARVPKRQIPPSVLVELRELENRFQLALAEDCHATRCFPKGCVYIDHAVSDQPRSTSLPGLALDPGPGSVEAQAWLTSARCGFAYEDSLASEEVSHLVRRLGAKLSGGWTVVTIESQALQPLAEELAQPETPEPPAAPPEPEPIPEPPPGTATDQLWAALLPHVWWMVGIFLFTLAASILLWAWRRVGLASPEEQALLAQLEREDSPMATGPGPEDSFVDEQMAAWQARVARFDSDDPDPALEALIRTLLETGELETLARLVLTFPDLTAAFPRGGDIAERKLAVADVLQSVDHPVDAAFFESLNRHALAASLLAQPDARMVRSLREEFGAAGIVALIDALSARAGALLFALAPALAQHEVARLLTPRRAAELADRLLQSNRASPTETDHLFAVLEAARDGRDLPPAPDEAISDRGTSFDATGALAVLLPGVSQAHRGQLFARALERFGGTVPTWYRGILLPEMLFEIPDTARADLLLEVDLESLAAWLSVLDRDVADRVAAALPQSVRTSIAATVFPSRARQLAQAADARRSLARGLQAQLARAGRTFEEVVRAMVPEA